MPWKACWISSATVSTEKRLEIEVKVRVDSLPPWRARLIALGAQLADPRQLEHNRVFDTPGGALKGRGVLLRLRRYGERNVLTMKTPPPESGTVYKVRDETEIAVPDFAVMEKILLGIGFRACFRYEKYREGFSLDETQVLLDETPIGCFIEIEGAPPAIDRVAARLGFSRDDYVRDSYHRLFLLSGGSGDMVFVP